MRGPKRQRRLNGNKPQQQEGGSPDCDQYSYWQRCTGEGCPCPSDVAQPRLPPRSLSRLFGNIGSRCHTSCRPPPPLSRGRENGRGCRGHSEAWVTHIDIWILCLWEAKNIPVISRSKHVLATTLNDRGLGGDKVVGCQNLQTIAPQ